VKKPTPHYQQDLVPIVVEVDSDEHGSVDASTLGDGTAGRLPRLLGLFASLGPPQNSKQPHKLTPTNKTREMNGSDTIDSSPERKRVVGLKIREEGQHHQNLDFDEEAMFHSFTAGDQIAAQTMGDPIISDSESNGFRDEDDFFMSTGGRKTVIRLAPPTRDTKGAVEQSNSVLSRFSNPRDSNIPQSVDSHQASSVFDDVFSKFKNLMGKTTPRKMESVQDGTGMEFRDLGLPSLSPKGKRKSLHNESTNGSRSSSREATPTVKKSRRRINSKDGPPELVSQENLDLTPRADNQSPYASNKAEDASDKSYSNYSQTPQVEVDEQSEPKSPPATKRMKDSPYKSRFIGIENLRPFNATKTETERNSTSGGFGKPKMAKKEPERNIKEPAVADEYIQSGVIGDDSDSPRELLNEFMKEKEDVELTRNRATSDDLSQNDGDSGAVGNPWLSTIRSKAICDTPPKRDLSADTERTSNRSKRTEPPLPPPKLTLRERFLGGGKSPSERSFNSNATPERNGEDYNNRESSPPNHPIMGGPRHSPSSVMDPLVYDSKGKQFIIVAPPGKLGIILSDNPDGSGATINGTQEGSVLKNQIQPGDKILSIDGEKVDTYDVSQIAALMRKTFKQEKQFVVLRTVQT